MQWQGMPRMDPSGAYGPMADPYMAHPMAPGHPHPHPHAVAMAPDDQHFFSSGTTREQEELARRKAEHMESAEHIAPQHSYPNYGARSSRLTEKALRENFHLPLSEVAKKFGMCTTAFKKLCRKQGVMQWPHRTLRSLEKKIASLRAEQKFTNDHNHIEDQVRKLQQKREAILSGTGLANLEGDDILASPSDDSASTDTVNSGSSSPRGTGVEFSQLALDDSSSVGSTSSSYSEERQRSSKNRNNDRSAEGREYPAGFIESGQFHEGFRPGMGGGPGMKMEEGAMRRPHPGYPMDRESGPYGPPGMMPMHDPHDPRFGPHRAAFPGMMGMGGPMMPGQRMWHIREREMMMMRPDGEHGPNAQDNPAALQQHVQHLLAENSHLKAVIRDMEREREEIARKSDGAHSEAVNYRMLCQQLEGQLAMVNEQMHSDPSMMNQMKGAAHAQANRRVPPTAQPRLQSKSKAKQQGQQQQREEQEQQEEGEKDPSSLVELNSQSTFDPYTI